MKNVPSYFGQRDKDGNPTGVVTKGHRVVCKNCGNESFFLFTVYLTTGEHHHTGCAKCQTIYCDGTCTQGDSTVNAEEN